MTVNSSSNALPAESSTQNKGWAKASLAVVRAIAATFGNTKPNNRYASHSASSATAPKIKTPMLGGNRSQNQALERICKTEFIGQTREALNIWNYEEIMT